MAHLYIASQHRCVADTGLVRHKSNVKKDQCVPSYHLSAQPVKRSEGRSVIAMAAYRAGARLADERRGIVADYSRRRGVVHAEILIPDEAADWLRDRTKLWNCVERLEGRCDAQLAREINIALPHELTDGQRLALVRAFVREQFVALGMVADVAIHRPVVEKGEDPRNHHAHILLTLRQATAQGLHAVKTREWNSRDMLRAWRAAWAAYQNDALRRCGHRSVVDHRTLEAQRSEVVDRGDHVRAAVLDREPELHVGPEVVARERRRTYERAVPFSDSVRIARNVRRLDRNVLKIRRRALRTEVRLVRLRLRLQHYDRIVSAGAHGWGSREGEEERIAHARRRRMQVLWLIDQLDRVFFALLGIREAQLVRKTRWSNRLGRGRLNDGAKARSSLPEALPYWAA